MRVGAVEEGHGKFSSGVHFRVLINPFLKRVPACIFNPAWKDRRKLVRAV